MKSQTISNIKKNKFLLFSVIFIFLFSLVVSAEFEYSTKGNIDKIYHLDGRGNFNENMEDETFYIKTLGNNNGEQPPLFFDINKDGVTDIFVSDGVNMKVYTNKTELDFLTGFSVATNIFDYIIHEYNNESYLVLVRGQLATSNPSRVNTFKWNTTSSSFNFLYEFYVATYSSSTVTCEIDSQYCLFYAANDGVVNGASFDIETGLVENAGIDSRFTSDFSMCLPSITDVTNVDIDDDGTNEYIGSYMEMRRSTGLFDAYLFTLSINSSGNIILENTQLIKSSGYIGTSTCVIHARAFTSPLIYDFIDNGKEDLIIGIAQDDNEFKMYSYQYITSSFNFVDDYPETLLADGIIISNPMVANAFQDTGLDDFCILGYTEDNGTDLLCASERTSFTPETREYKSRNFTNTFELDLTTNQHIVHSTQHENTLTDGTDLSEIITPFGIYKLESGVFFDDFTPIYQLDTEGGIMIDGDIENSGLNDLFYLNQNSLIYIDDGFINGNAVIDSYTINPCIDNIWKQNTTVAVTLNAIDDEADDVRYRTILYYDHPNENITQDSNWSIFVNSGTDVQFSFDADTKIGVGNLRLMTQDDQTEHSTDYDIIDLTFTVSDDGVSFGDCTTTVSNIIEEAEEEEEEEGVSMTDNSITDVAEEIERVSNIPILLFFIVLVLMLDLIIFIGGLGHPMAALITIIVVDLLGFIIASFLGILPTAFVISMYAIIVIVGGIYIAHIINKSSGGS